MTTTAVANNFRIAQAFLGAKIHDPKDPGADLSAMLYQVVNAAFELMETYKDVWKQVRGSEEVPTFGFQYTVGLEQVTVNVDRMLTVFREGIENLRDIWTRSAGERGLPGCRGAGQEIEQGLPVPEGVMDEDDLRLCDRVS